MAKIAMFGLGNMGMPIAECLLKKGHQMVTAIHHSDKGPKRLESLGGEIANSDATAVQGAEYIITCVPDDASLKEFLLNPEMIDAIQSGQVIIDLTTCAADTVKEVAAPYLEKGVKFIDAPLTGQPVHAYEGKITLLCGCALETFEEARAFMSEFSKQQWYLGDVGTGKVAKLCNNLMTATNKLFIGELVKIIKANGVDEEAFKNVISTSPNHSEQFDLVYPKVCAGDFETKFAVRLMRKDVRLAMDISKGLNCEVAELVYKMYRRASQYDELDCNAVIKAEDLPV